MTIAILADVVYSDDIGVLQAGRGVCFLAKAAQEIGIAGEALMQHLHRYKTAEHQILRLVDHRHTAAADAFDYFVAVV